MNTLLLRFAKIWTNSGKTLRRLKSVDDPKPSLKIEDRLLSRFRYLLAYLYRKMGDSADLQTCSGVSPPDSVKGMTELSRKEFTTSVKLPALKIPKKEMGANQKIWKPLQLKIRNLKPVGELGDKDPDRDTHSLIFLDPDKLKAEILSEAQKSLMQKFGVDLENPQTFELELHYSNWSVADILRAVLPSDADNVTSFTQIGHIAHLNLKPESLPYKHLIGEVILDKIPSVKTVVNKLNAIDNTYRNFQMELLAGEENYITHTKEHNCTFELDFSKVYWNSRLSTEHQRIVDMIDKRSVVFDVFAGIGPFAVPLAKKRQCTVFANDLNPASFEYLKRNIVLNKIKEERLLPYNMDGRDFIKTIVKDNLIHQLNEAMNSNLPEKEDVSAKPLVISATEKVLQNTQNKSDGSASEIQRLIPPSYVVMNLPALAVDFLDTFNGLLSDLPSHLRAPNSIQPVLPFVICYAFSAKTEMEKELRTRVERALGQTLSGELNVRIVRNVAPNKEMMCLSFKLWPELVLGTSNSQGDWEPESKKQKLSSA